ncbi:hypothetical protein RQP46_006999 [Phenoliferia psychrophenolica]
MSYRVEIHFFDFDPSAPHPLAQSPLHPHTLTLLPPALDRDLRLRQRGLCLPRTFWQNLPSSGPLDTTATGALQPAPPPRASSDSAAATGTATQEATLDFRFGPLSLDWVDYPFAQKSGTTDLYWGTVHLFRELGAEDSTAKEKQSAIDADDGTVVGMIAVPGNVNAAVLLAFISPALDSVEQLRVLRDSTPNRTMVLIRFREAADASEFKVMYNGKPYHDTKESEVCRVVAISSIRLKSSSTPPFTFPYSPELEPASKNGVELPTCPVCLERMDGSVTGLITVVCQHSFHCSCLLKWGDSRCPVCRSTNYRTRSGTLSSPTTSTCTICQSTSNLWICLICGNVGCGRYQGGHAHTHFAESGHAYSMELETQRVWDYVTDSYVHRLIRSRADGSLVELPSLSSKPDDKDKEKDKGGKSGPDREDELEQDKLEAMGVEYAKLMTAQLEEQRRYYEVEIARSREELAIALRRAEAESRKAHSERIAGEQRMEEAMAKFEAGQEQLRAKLEQVLKSAGDDEARRKKERAEVAKAKKELERELEAEKEVTKALAEKVRWVKDEVGGRDAEMGKQRAMITDLEDQMRDLMFALSARDQIEAQVDSYDFSKEVDLEALATSIKRTGGVICKNVCNPADLAAMEADVRPFIVADKPWTGSFFPAETRRVTGLVTKSPTFVEKVLMNPTYQAMADKFLTSHTTGHLGSEFVECESKPQLMNTIVFAIGPGGKDAHNQPLHRDDSIYHVQHPEATPETYKYGRDLQIAFFLAGKKSTKANGATRFIPGSHLWAHEKLGGHHEEDCVYAELDAGDCFMMLGSAQHGGSANTTLDEERLILSCFMTKGYLRQEENQYLTNTLDTVRAYPIETARVIGYNLSIPSLGWVGFEDPIRLLHPEVAAREELY